MNTLKTTIIEPYRSKRVAASMGGGGLIGFPLGCWASGITVGGQVVMQTFLSTILCKFVFIASGIRMGWSVGTTWWDENDCLKELLQDKKIWKYLHDEIPVVVKNTQKDENIHDSNSVIGNLYQMSLLVFLERFNVYQSESKSIKSTILSDYNQLVYLLSVKIPWISREDWDKHVYRDTYPYIYSSYWMEQQINNVSSDRICEDQEDNEKLSNLIYHRTLPIFKKITQVQHPQLKLEVLKSVIEEIVQMYHIQFWKMPSCEEIMPIICAMLVKYSSLENGKSCLPIADIHMVYDYFGSNFDESGYISTLWMSAIHKVNPTSKALVKF